MMCIDAGVLRHATFFLDRRCVTGTACSIFSSFAVISKMCIVAGALNDDHGGDDDAHDDDEDDEDDDDDMMLTPMRTTRMPTTMRTTTTMMMTTTTTMSTTTRMMMMIMMIIFLRTPYMLAFLLSHPSLLTSGDNALLGTVGWNRHCKCTVANTNWDSRMESPL